MDTSHAKIVPTCQVFDNEFLTKKCGNAALFFATEVAFAEFLRNTPQLNVAPLFCK